MLLIFAWKPVQFILSSLLKRCFLKHILMSAALTARDSEALGLATLRPISFLAQYGPWR